MYNWMKNQISKLYSAVSAPVAASRDALAERLQSVRDTASLLSNRMMNNIGYGQETLKDIVENTAAKEEEEPLAIQKPLNEQPTDDLTYIAKHVPVSVAICHTLTGEPVYLVDKDPEKLVEKFMDVLSKKCDEIVKDVETKYPYPFDFMMFSKEVKKN